MRSAWPSSRQRTNNKSSREFVRSCAATGGTISVAVTATTTITRTTITTSAASTAPGQAWENHRLQRVRGVRRVCGLRRFAVRNLQRPGDRRLLFKLGKLPRLLALRRQSGYGIGGIPRTMDEMSQEKMIVFRMQMRIVTALAWRGPDRPLLSMSFARRSARILSVSLADRLLTMLPCDFSLRGGHYRPSEFNVVAAAFNSLAASRRSCLARSA